MSFLFIVVLLGFKDIGISANWGKVEEDCHIVAHLWLGPQWFGGADSIDACMMAVGSTS